MLCRGYSTIRLALQPGHHEVHVLVPHFPNSWPHSLELLYRLSCSQGNGVSQPASTQLCVHFLEVTKSEHQLPCGYALGHLLSGKLSPASPSLTTWVLLQLNEMVEPCMVRMDSIWGTLPATI